VAGVTRQRVVIVLGLLATVALGLLSRRVHLGIGLWDKSLGDALYAVMIYALCALARPRWRPVRVAAVAVAICFAIETFQLTGLPARAPRLLRIALGDTFTWHDMACYVVGGAAAGLLHARFTSE